MELFLTFPGHDYLETLPKEHPPSFYEPQTPPRGHLRLWCDYASPTPFQSYIDYAMIYIPFYLNGTFSDIPRS